LKGKSWSAKEDNLLKEKVLESIANGRSLRETFKEVGYRINRTAGACGFRWNSFLKKQCFPLYNEAKQKRVYTQLKKYKIKSFDSIMYLANALKHVGKACFKLRQEVYDLKEEAEKKDEFLKYLQNERKELLAKYKEYDFSSIKSKYTELLNIAKNLKIDASIIENFKMPVTQIMAQAKQDSPS